MAVVRFVLGGEANIASSEELNTVEGRLTNHINTLTPHKEEPLWRSGVGAGVAPTTGLFIVPLVPKSPAVGRIWNLTQLVALGADDHTVLSNVTVSWYLSDPANPDLGQVVYPVMPIPGSQSFSSRVLWQHPQEELFGVITGATPGQIVTLIMRMGDYPDTSVMPNRI